MDRRTADSGMPVIRRIDVAAQRCKSTPHDFFRRAELNGTPNARYSLEASVEAFLKMKNELMPFAEHQVPKHVLAFADRVLAAQCPRKCDKPCLRAI